MSISISIDVTKIDRSRIKDHSNGSKYLDLTLIDTPDSQYGDHYMVVQKSSADERQAGVKLPILGNGKDWSRIDQQQAPQQPAPPAQQTADDGDDIPF